MSDDLEARVKARVKATALVALAVGNANEYEARNAAIEACRLIAKHKLLDLGHVAPTPQQPVRGHRVVVVDGPFGFGDTVGTTMSDVFEELFRHARAHTVRPEPPKPPPPARPAPPADHFDWEEFDLTEPPHHHVATEEDYPHERVIRVPSWCAGCGQRMTDGQLVKVMLDRTGKETLWHRPCWDRGKKP